MKVKMLSKFAITWFKGRESDKYLDKVNGSDTRTRQVGYKFEALSSGPSTDLKCNMRYVAIYYVEYFPMYAHSGFFLSCFFRIVIF